MIKHFEGCSCTAYRDVRGIWTIGWGSIWLPEGSAVKSGCQITQDQADAMLLQDVKDWGVHVLSLLEGKAFSDNEVAALISFSYNVGIGAFASSTMRQDLLVGSILLAASQFLLWNHSGGKVVRGLTVRRKIEQAVFLGATFTPALCTLIEDSVPQ